MKTMTEKTGEILIVSFNGTLDFETPITMKKNLLSYIHSNDKIVMNLENLDFVGSCGISNFLDALAEINSHATQNPHYCHVKTEFCKLIKAFDHDQHFDLYDDLDHATKSFS